MAPSVELPSGTLTFLFTDIEGSTRLLKELGRSRYSELLATHHRLLRSVFGEHGGIEVDRQGDSLFVVFRSAEAAVAAAAHVQRALAAEQWPEGASVRIRVGLHTGEAALGNGGYVGFAVHQAARIGAAARGGQILLSSTTAKLVEHEPPVVGRLVDLGERRLRGLDQPERLFALELEGGPATAREPAVPPHRREATSPTPLLGREAEVAALAALVDAARGGDGRLVAIEGSAGIGKTRLLAEVRAAAAAVGLDVLAARAGELEREFAFGVVRQLFEPLLSNSSADERAELLSGAAALAAPLFDQAQLQAGEDASGDASFPMLHGLYWLAANVALRRPLLLAVDDLHWADAASLRWLVYLARRLDGLPLLLVLATRAPSEESSMVEELLADPAAVVVRPGPLGTAAVATLVGERLAAEPEEAFVAAAETASGGNPLFLRALLEACVRDQLAPTAANAAGLLEIGPEAVARGVSLRLARMPEAARALLRAAAILGDGTELPLVAALAGLDTASALSAATALVRADLLRQENPLEFVHPIVRTAVHEDMAAGDRMRAHRRAAEVLLDRGALPEQAATYLALTLPAEDQFVVATLRRAATRSLAQGAPEAAVSYLRRALEEPPTAAERSDVLGELGRAEVRTFETAAAADHLRGALAELDDVTLRPDLVLAYVHSLTILAERAPEAVGLLEQLTERVREEPELHERVAARLLIAAHHEPELYAIVQERWPELDQEKEGPIRAGSLLAMGAIVEGRRGVDRARAIELAKRALAAGIAGSEDALFGFAPLYTLTMAGEVEAAAAAYPDAIELARRRGDRFAAAFMCLFRGRLRTEQGELLAAEDDLTAPDALAMSDLPTPLCYRAAFLADTLLERGQIGEAEQLLGTVPIERVHVGHRIHFLFAKGKVELEAGRAEQALGSLLAARTIADSVDIENPAFVPWRSQAALALQQLGRDAEARELATEELELSRRWGAARTVGVSLRTLGLVEGGASGEQRLREAVEVLTESPARLELARALVDLGAALRRANSRREARERLRAGIELAQSCGARALVERANDELAATGAHRRTIVYSGVDALTASERRVAQLAAGGASNKEIAQALYVTVKTVEMHLSRVYRKLELTSRGQLAGALAAPEPEIAAATP